MKKCTLLLFSALLLASCHGARYHFKQGNRFAEAGALKRAVTEYKFALDRQPNKAKYIAAMNTHGTALLEELYTNYRFADGNDSLSVYKFLEAEKWKIYIKPYISLSRYEGFYTRDFIEQRSRYMARVYKRSHSLIRTKDYQKAQRRLSELNELDPNYKDVKSLLRFSEVEPVYTAALEEFELGKYKEAYYRLQPMYKKYPDQNELKLLMDEALDRGVYRIGIVSDPNLTGKESLMSNAVQSRLISELYRLGNPFLELVDRTNFDLIQEEQQAIVQGTTSDGALTQELLSANAYLKVVVNVADEIEGELKLETKKGYERFYVKTKNKEGETVMNTKYRKVTYREYWKENRVHYIAELILTDRATSKILSVNSFEFDDEDKAHYINYNNDQLFPGYWKYQSRDHHSDRPELAEYKRKELARLRKASKSIKSPAKMRKSAINYFAQTSAKHIQTLDLRP
ncbi:MAG TPA: hypothetical protein DIT65_04535 [Cryomorphaceae bacterium]|nr:hypothetical protein [Cryomorphaceae bacterium]|tara:strand:+ start:4845 stop:6215 length:1371 start_codon:yes stop_codon:yes gene_type:complete